MTIQEKVFEAMKRNGKAMHLNDIILSTGLNKTQVQGALYHLGSLHNVATSKGNGVWQVKKNAEFVSRLSGAQPESTVELPSPTPHGAEAGDLFEMVGKTVEGRTVVRSVDDQVIYMIEPIYASSI